MYTYIPMGIVFVMLFVRGVGAQRAGFLFR